MNFGTAYFAIKDQSRSQGKDPGNEVVLACGPSGRQDTTGQLHYIFAYVTVMTDLALQVAEANRGGPGH